jgi:alpha-tubulin suppressor-like RCC1 family protein
MVGKRVVGVAAGHAHTVVWTDEGKAYSFGNGSHLGCGNLGHGDDEDELVPRLIEGVLVGKRVVGVAAGHAHTVVWTDEGKAYSFGVGPFGRLGHGGTKTELVPKLIEGVLVGKRVVGVSAGSDHTVVWTNEGNAYSFGDGQFGQLGHGGEEHQHAPRLIEGVPIWKRVV